MAEFFQVPQDVNLVEAGAMCDVKPKVRPEEVPDLAPLSHPVWHQVAMKNGEINKMTKDQLKQKLVDLRLDTRGVKEVLKKRLKNYYKKQKLSRAQVRPPGEPHVDYYMVIDFEATCQEHTASDFTHEIIEFPVVLIDAHQRKVVDEFHSYVRPIINPKLTPFCTSLTGITQHEVDRSETFPTILHDMEAWMVKHRLGTETKFSLVTDGPWDMSRFMYHQCITSEIAFPRWSRKWINLRKTYCNFYKIKRAKLSTMLEYLGMVFEGQQHSGIDDARNIARIVIHLLEDGCDMKVNEKLFPHKIQNVNFNQFEASVRSLGKELDSSDEDMSLQERKDMRGSKFVPVEQLEQDLEGLHLHGRVAEKESRVGVNDVRTAVNHLPNENYDDLLSYYSLQNT